MKRASGPRKTATLSGSLNHQLNGYALAASAAGVGLLALAPLAEAKIVYTPAHAKVGKALPVDLNHDGITDFYLNTFLGSDTHGLSACQYWFRDASGSIYCSASRGTNAIRTINSNGRKYAAALRYGQTIQRGEQFATAGRVILGYSNPGNTTNWRGPWVNGGQGVKHRYLGLKFKIKGQVHYGWARITVNTTPFDFTATLTGYAYETVPGKGIIAGHIKETEDAEQSDATPVTQTQPTLGALALGAPGLSIWRRKESVVPGD